METKVVNRIGYSAILILLICLFLLVFTLIPKIYDLINGKGVIENHIKEVIRNSSDPDESALDLLNWTKNIHYIRNEEQIGFKKSFYSFDYAGKNKTGIFFRDVPASWTIKYKIGKCREEARYFVEIMSYLGFSARIIEPIGWDHALAEYYNLKGYKIVVNPADGKVISNPPEFVKGLNFTKIYAVDLKTGKREDVTSEYLPN